MLLFVKVIFLYRTCAQPPFLSGKFTLKILTLQTYLVGVRSENADLFSTLAKNSVKFFSQNRFTKAFSLLFATYPNLAAIVATRP